MTADLTPLGQRRADTVAVGQAVRALRAGCRPGHAAAFLAVYCGLPLRRIPQAEEPRPNVVMITADDTGASFDAQRTLIGKYANGYQFGDHATNGTITFDQFTGGSAAITDDMITPPKRRSSRFRPPWRLR